MRLPTARDAVDDAVDDVLVDPVRRPGDRMGDGVDDDVLVEGVEVVLVGDERVGPAQRWHALGEADEAAVAPAVERHAEHPRRHAVRRRRSAVTSPRSATSGTRRGSTSGNSVTPRGLTVVRGGSRLLLLGGGLSSPCSPSPPAAASSSWWATRGSTYSENLWYFSSSIAAFAQPPTKAKTARMQIGTSSSFGDSCGPAWASACSRSAARAPGRRRGPDRERRRRCARRGGCRRRRRGAHRRT